MNSPGKRMIFLITSAYLLTTKHWWSDYVETSENSKHRVIQTGRA